MASIISLAFRMLIEPFKSLDLLWISMPLLLSMILVEIYFGRYKREELGWNTAVTNSMVLVYTGIDLLRRLFSKSRPYLTFPTEEFIVSMIVIIIGASLFYLNFFHKLPKHLAFTLTSVLPINMIAYFALLIVYTDISPSWISLAAWLLLSAGLWGLFQMVHMFEKSEDAYAP